ncbi:MAG: isoprenylcysteine carboxylmethyltransferase family protein [Mariprofundaceae bacterium]|nr:isoprenylcysteine carboxylmethyltransferase family protein [Mariprofundaceae bacterium]
MTPYQEFIYHHRPRITGAVAIVLLFFSYPTLQSLLIGTVIVLLGAVGRTWASGYIDKDQKLATCGPYAYTRNPLYVFNFTMFVGCCVMSANIWVGLACMISFLLIYSPVIRVEAQRMADYFGDDYHNWALHVPLFFPRFTAFSSNDNRPYSFKLMFEHKEHHHWVWTVIGIGIFYALYFYRTMS